MKLKSLLIAASLVVAAVASAAGLPWAKDYNSALAAAKNGNNVVMVDFTAVWCVNCHKLEKTTYRDPAVMKMLSNTVPVQVDTDKQPAIAKKYKVEALPVILFLDARGKEIGRIIGYWNAKDFQKKVAPILAKARK